jgi:hypothetical protein
LITEQWGWLAPRDMLFFQLMSILGGMCDVLFCLIVTEFRKYTLMYNFYCLDERCAVLQCYLLQFFYHLAKVPTSLTGLIVVIFFSDQKKEGRSGTSHVYRSIWKPSKGKKIEAAMKTLKPDCRDKYLKVMNVL